MKKLSRGANNEVWALSSDKVAKLFEVGDPAARKEHKLLAAAAAVNGLSVKPHKIQFDDEFRYELLVMERLYGLQHRFIDLDRRKEMVQVFESQLRELHRSGIAHGDLMRNCDQGGKWDNIVPTLEGIRLIDFGIGATEEDPNFSRLVATDLQDLESFKADFLAF